MTGPRRFRFGMRAAFALAGVVAIAVGALIYLLGQRQIELVHRLAAEGRVAESRYLRTRTGGRDESDEITYAYTVAGRGYEISTYASINRSAPLIEQSLVANPEWGPATPAQVVYLPSDPSIAMLRDDLDADPLAFHLAGGLFALVGTAFVLASLLLPRRRRGLGG